MGQISWQRAVTLWWTDKVEILEEYEDREIRSTTWVMKIPAVVRFLGRVRVRRQGLRFSRENVYARDGGACQYCGTKLKRREATYDHVIPRTGGGTTNWENIVIACARCNQRKGGRTPERAGMTLRSTPVAPRSLPTTIRITFANREDVPSSWRQYLFELAYWHGALEQD
jgi:5-methylcytosine-specific restriction endonuclease McrA